MIDNQYDCYLVPMKDVYYSVCDGGGINFELFIEHDNTFYYTNVTKKPENFMVKSVAVRSALNNTFVGTLYRLDNNMIEYHYLTPIRCLNESLICVICLHLLL